MTRQTGPGAPFVTRPGAFEGQDHLVDSGRGDAEEAPHVGFGGRAGIDASVGVNERQVLPLPGREGRFDVGL